MRTRKCNSPLDITPQHGVHSHVREEIFVARQDFTRQRCLGDVKQVLSKGNLVRAVVLGVQLQCLARCTLTLARGANLSDAPQAAASRKPWITVCRQVSATKTEASRAYHGMNLLVDELLSFPQKLACKDHDACCTVSNLLVLRFGDIYQHLCCRVVDVYSLQDWWQLSLRSETCTSPYWWLRRWSPLLRHHGHSDSA